MFSFKVISEPVAISIADVSAMAVIAYLLAKNRSFDINLISLLFGFLAVIAIISGLYNIVAVESSAAGNFAVHLIRLIAFSIALTVIPPLLRKSDPVFIVKALSGIIAVHIIFVVAHYFSFLPFPANQYEYIVAGLFREPAWFGIWAFLTLAVVVQHEWNKTRTLIPILISIAIFVSGFLVHSGSEFTLIRASLSPIFLSTIALLFVLGARFRVQVLNQLSAGKQLAALVGVGILVAAFISVSLFLLPNRKGLDDQPQNFVESFTDRINKIVRRTDDPMGQDASANLRIYGAWELALKSTGDSPLLGTGLGGDNLIRVYKKHEADLRYVYRFGNIGVGQIPAEILRSLGILGFLTLAAIYVVMLKNSRSIIVGTSIIVAGFFWGDPFSMFLCPFYAFAAAQMPSLRTLRSPGIIQFGGGGKH